MIIADIIAKELESNGVDTIFTYPGGTIAFLLDSISSKTDIKIITNRTEQGASFAASAYSKSGNGLGVCMATSGCGFTNLITGIADVYYDHTPMLVITGQVGTTFLNEKNKMRQQGFQQIDVLKICEPITVYRKGLYSTDNISDNISKAIFYSKQNLGVSLLDIPIDIQRTVV